MALAKLGAVDPFYLDTTAGWDLPSFVQLVPLLSDGSSTGNQVMQSGSTPLRQNSIKGTVLDAADMVLLRGYNASKEAIEFLDPGDEDLMVRILDFSAAATDDESWSIQATLVEAPDVELP